MRFLGVDGCRFGWIGICFFDQGWSFYLEKHLKTLMEKSNPDICFIDIPISLSKNESVRECDAELRKLLPNNFKSSVFNAPVKLVLEAKDYLRGKEINQFITGKKITKQTWNIVPKIREVNNLLDHKPVYSRIFYEAHPETFFFRFNNDKPLNFKKKTPGGRIERLEILEQLYSKAGDIYNEIVMSTLRKNVNYDDVLDALVLALGCKIIYPDNMQAIPAKLKPDDKGVLQNVFIPKRKSYLK